MRILHISDLHTYHYRIKWPVDPKTADVIVCSGDISDRGEEHQVKAFFKWFKAIEGPAKILVAGNHDISFDPERNGLGNGAIPTWLEYELAIFQFEANDTFPQKRNYYLNDSGCEINGVKFWGSPVTPWFYGDYWAFNKYRGAEIKKTWDIVPRGTQVLITHGPAFGHVDWLTREALYLGCEDLTKKIADIKPVLHLCGHIHDGYGWEQAADSIFVNSSICNEAYNPINLPHVIDIDFEEKEAEIFNTEQ